VAARWRARRDSSSAAKANCLPICAQADLLRPITPAWAARTGLPADTRIHCGLHDSSALLAASFAEIAD
jgi:sugar (pentulose or hexulose) kinase